jgi:sugar transferase (PEP-CTERM system associated)
MRVVFGGGAWRNASLLLIDHVLIVGAVLLAALIRNGSGQTVVDWNLIWRAALIALVLQLALHYCDLYDLRTIRDRRNLAMGLLQAIGATSLILGVLYYWVPALIVGRGVFLLTAGLTLILLGLWRLAFEWLSARVGPSERLLIVGTGSAAIELARELDDRRQFGADVVGFVGDDQPTEQPSGSNSGVLGRIADIPQLVATYKVDRVVVSVADARGKFPIEALLEMRLSAGVRFDHLASTYEEYTGKIAVENLRPSWFIFSAGFRKTQTLMTAKRAMDTGLAAIGILITLPVMAVVAVAIKLTSPGPIFYHQMRVGQNGQTFTVHKFRSMRSDAEASTGAVWAQRDDPRVTTVGRVTRKTRLDELPQLWNVLLGEMSLVGPRPERPEFVAELTAKIPFYGQRHLVKPGVTGWAQVRYSYGASVRDSLEKLQYDLFYIKNMSMAFDVYILFETMKTIVLRRGAS